MARAPRDVAQSRRNPVPFTPGFRLAVDRATIESRLDRGNRHSEIDYQSYGFGFLTGFFVIGPRFYRAATRHRTT